MARNDKRIDQLKDSENALKSTDLFAMYSDNRTEKQPLSNVIDYLQSTINTSYFTGGTINGTTTFTDTISACTSTVYINTLSPCGGTGSTMTFSGSIDISGQILSGGTDLTTLINNVTSLDTYVTGATLTDATLELGRNQGLSTLSVDLSSLSGTSYWVSADGVTSMTATTTTDVYVPSLYLTRDKTSIVSLAGLDFNFYKYNSGNSMVSNIYAGEGSGSFGMSTYDDSTGEGSGINLSTRLGASNNVIDLWIANTTGNQNVIFKAAENSSLTINNNLPSTFDERVAVFVGGHDNIINSGVKNTVVIGGSGMTATQHNTVYVPHLEIGGQANTPVYNSGTGTTFTLNFNNSNIQTITVTGNTTMNNPSNVKDGAVYTVIIKQGATTGTINSWDTNFKFEGGTAPTLTTNPYAVDIITFISDDVGNLYGLTAFDFQ